MATKKVASAARIAALEAKVRELDAQVNPPPPAPAEPWFDGYKVEGEKGTTYGLKVFGLNLSATI